MPAVKTNSTKSVSLTGSAEYAAQLSRCTHAGSWPLATARRCADEP